MMSLATAAAMCVCAARAYGVGAHSTLLVDMSTTDVVELLGSWGLGTAFGEPFLDHNISGSDVQIYFKRGRVNQKSFAPYAQPFQWDKLWARLESMVPSKAAPVAHTRQRKRRRRLSAATPSGLRITTDDATVWFGPDSDAYIERSGDGVLGVNGTLSMLQADGSSNPFIDTETLKTMVSSIVKEAVSGLACEYGTTGTYCNETCPNVSHYVMPACFYHDTPSTEDLQLEDAAASPGWYRPELEAATIQCCSDTTCTRKKSGTSTCLAGVRSQSAAYDIYVDWFTANQTCADNGMRLCTVAEFLVEGHDCCGSGCGYDASAAWTSDMQYDCGGLQSYGG